MSLTDKEIKALRPSLKRATLSDGRGLFLDITPKGSLTWIFRYRMDGKQEKVTIGPYPIISLKDARTERDKLAGEVAKGNSPAEAKREAKEVQETQSVTFRKFAERYYDEQVLKNWKDPANERRNLEKYLYPALGDRELKDITALDIQSVVYPIRDGGILPRP